MAFVRKECTKEVLDALGISDSARALHFSNTADRSVVCDLERRVALQLMPQTHSTYPDRHAVLYVDGVALSIVERPATFPVSKRADCSGWLEVSVPKQADALSDQVLEGYVLQAYEVWKSNYWCEYRVRVKRTGPSRDLAAQNG